MTSFSIAIDYLTGYAVATDSANRAQPEWPPHPARVFMALAAAHFETDGPPEQKRLERDALEWLATLEPPAMTVPRHTVRDVLTVYVPVNDQASADAIIRRSRQPRLFPRVHIGDATLRLTWQAEARDMHHVDGLQSICRNVTRIGHSSSLVWVRVERDGVGEPTHVPDEQALNRGYRIVQSGAVARLEQSYNREAVDAYAAIDQQIAEAKGPAKKKLQERRDKQFPSGKPVSQRPAFSISRGYRPANMATSEASPSLFDPNFLVLSSSDEARQNFGLESTAQMTAALRNVLMKKSPQPVPPWVSGHEANGDRLQSSAHLAIVPLAHVESEFADGHLMGLGILIPRAVPYRDRAKVLSNILFDEQNEIRKIKLVLGAAGEWLVEREGDLTPKVSLQPLTYARESRSWASVTPVVLDRMPKSDRVKSPIEWREEVAGIVAQSCKNVGLPEPVAVRVEKTPFFQGSLRAMPGQGGFPLLREGAYQVHVMLEFERPVGGPALIGAGRFRGYGLMRPWKGEVGR